MISSTNLKELFLERIATGLKRKSVTSPARWAEEYRIMGEPIPGPWTFKYHPWLKEMHNSTAEMNCGMKSAQMGFTETMLNLTFYKIDIEQVDCLYVLPANKPDASDFSSSRFDVSLELSDHLSKLFSDVKNIGHKRAGTASLYIRGSKSRSQLKSVPVGFVVLDEIDEMNQRNVPLAYERTAGQRKKLIWELSTPTVVGTGIHARYETSSKEHFFFRCPHCSRLTELIWPECFNVTATRINDPDINRSHLLCKECKHPLDHSTKSEWLKLKENGGSAGWVSEYTNIGNDSEKKYRTERRGFHINKLYSMMETASPVSIAESYIKSQASVADEQELYNSTLGLPYLTSQVQLGDADLDKCTSKYLQKAFENHHILNGMITMGVDVGKKIHYEIDHWSMPPNNKISSTDINVLTFCRVIKIGTVDEFEELDKLFINYKIKFAVVDAQPERRKALELARRFPKRVRLCFYNASIRGKNIHLSQDDECYINVDRSTWLDLSLGRFRGNPSISIPFDHGEEYRNHLKCLVRRYEKDKDGNQTSVYVESNTTGDHFAHARNYAEIALKLGVARGQSYNITEKIL